MICPKCGSENVAVQMVTETGLRSGHGLVWWLLIGWWWVPVKWFCFFWVALILKLFGNKSYRLKTSQHSECVCQNCGYHWKAEAPESVPQAAQGTAPAPEDKRTAVDRSHYISGCETVGESYYKDAIAELGTIDRNYYWPNERLYEKFVDGDRVYKFRFEDMDAELVPEPDNPHDPNAIRVDVNGKTVGHIARDNTAHIRELLESGATARAKISAGPRKVITESDDGQLTAHKEDFDFRVWLSFFEPVQKSTPAPVSRSSMPELETSPKSGIMARVLFWLFALLGLAAACGVFYIGFSQAFPLQYMGFCIAGTLVFGVVAYILTNRAFD